MTDTLFAIAANMGDLPVGATFTYSSWGAGTVTHNDGHTVEAVISKNGHKVATYTALVPGEEVEI